MDDDRKARITIADAIALDERLAAEGRNSVLEPLEVNERLAPGETAFVVRRGVLVDEPGGTAGEVFAGDLVVTDQRLLIRGPVRSLEVPLQDIAEMAAIGPEVLQIDLGAGRGLALQLQRPRHLRVQIQAARHASPSVRVQGA
jgi:hypothetical protein